MTSATAMLAVALLWPLVVGPCLAETASEVTPSTSASQSGGNGNNGGGGEDRSGHPQEGQSTQWPKTFHVLTNISYKCMFYLLIR